MLLPYTGSHVWYSVLVRPRNVLNRERASSTKTLTKEDGNESSGAFIVTNPEASWEVEDSTLRDSIESELVVDCLVRAFK
jgi:hypothetical protein